MTPDHSATTGASADPPLIVVDGDDAAFDGCVAEVERAGFPVVAGFDGDAGALGEVRCGPVETVADAGLALLTVLAGAGAVIHARGSRQVIDRLLDDLRHVRRVEVRRGPAATAPRIDPDAVAILEILAGGRTLGDAAHELGLSRRTADRRLSDARAALGVERTVEAVARARRLGLLGREERA